MIDYPTSMAELDSHFATQESCLAYLAALRRPSGFVCPRCGTAKGWEMRNGLFLCSGCRCRQSIQPASIEEPRPAVLQAGAISGRHAPQPTVKIVPTQDVVVG